MRLPKNWRLRAEGFRLSLSLRNHEVTANGRMNEVSGHALNRPRCSSSGEGAATRAMSDGWGCRARDGLRDLSLTSPISSTLAKSQ